MSLWSLKLSFGALLSLASLLGVLLPLLSPAERSSPLLAKLRPAATGVLFSIIFCHLLPDASRRLDDPDLLPALLGAQEKADAFPLAGLLLLAGAALTQAAELLLPCPHTHEAGAALSKERAPPRAAAAPAFDIEAAALPAPPAPPGEGTPLLPPAAPRRPSSSFSSPHPLSELLSTSADPPPLPPSPPLVSGRLAKRSRYLKAWNERTVHLTRRHLHVLSPSTSTTVPLPPGTSAAPSSGAPASYKLNAFSVSVPPPDP
ncbi:hypothetical protein TeGR_g12319, partial [Tetraparma gracilis]